MNVENETTGAEAPQGAAAPAGEPKVTFAELGLRDEVLRALSDMGFTHAMHVQASTIPLIREGRDLMVQSRTGSGKTAAFGIPFADSIVNPEEKFVQAIVLLPTRELALQVAAEMARIAAHSSFTVVPVYGGAPMGKQIEQLRAGGQVVCGTPGRILDHIRRGTLKLDRVKCAVLDECDEMLSMGFQEDIEAILQKTPAERQTLLFSATVPPGIQRISRQYMRSPEFVKLSADFVGVHEIRHVYYSIPGGSRENELLRVIEFENPERAIVFCNTREETGRVAEFLRRQGMDAEAISSDLSQSDRERVMGRMRAHDIRFLVATDVAARGIDLEKLPCVINYTFPESPEVYIHRTGRTGRAGRQGTAISLIGPTEVGPFYYIKLLYKIKPEERSLPSETEIRSKREGERILQLRTVYPVEAGAEWRSLARRLVGAPDGEKLIAAMLAQALGGGVAEAARVPTPRRVDVEEREAPAGEARPRQEERERRPPRSDRPEREAGGREREYGRRDREGGDRGRDRGRERRPGGDRPERRDGRPARPDRGTGRGERPVRASSPTGEAKEFWEVWSEEVGRSGGAPPEGAPAPESIDAEALEAVVPAERPERAERERRPERERDRDRDRGRERERRPEPSFEVPEGHTRLYLNLGRKDGATPEEIAGLLSAEGITLAATEIETMNTHSYVNVVSENADRLCAALAGKERDGRKLVCEPARPPKRR